MILPPDNSLTLAESLDEFVLDPTSKPAPTTGDVTALLPGWAQDVSSPVRDALMAAIGAVANKQWAHNGQAVAREASPLFADGQWLDYWGSLLKLPRIANEEDGPYRARLLNPPDRISPNAIQAIVRADTARFTATPPAFEEPAVDGIFFAGLSSPWQAFWQPTNGRLWAHYPGSLCLTPGAYWAPVNSGALFWVILPEAAVFGLATDFYSSRLVTAPSFYNPAALPLTWSTNDEVFYDLGGQGLAASVISDVEFRRAAGVAWALIVDPNLARAL